MTLSNYFYIEGGPVSHPSYLCCYKNRWYWGRDRELAERFCGKAFAKEAAAAFGTVFQSPIRLIKVTEL